VILIISLATVPPRSPGSAPRSGRSRHWIKSKNPAAPAVKREAEEAKNRPPKGKGGQDSEVQIKAGAVMNGDSMTANHFEHEIATFPGSPDMASHRV
jgi:hypothetical protein